jgi:hypothetical protein
MNGTGDIFNVWLRRYALTFENIDLLMLLLTYDQACKKRIFEVFCVSAGNIKKYGKDRIIGQFFFEQNSENRRLI